MYIDFAPDLQQKEPEPDLKDLYDSSYIRDITIDELADALSSLCQKYPEVVHTPFPHILIHTTFGQMILTDEHQGYLKSQISMNHISVRCTLDGPNDSPAPRSPSISFPIQPMFTVLSRKPHVCLKSKVILTYESVGSLLSKISDVVKETQTVYEKLYPSLSD